MKRFLMLGLISIMLFACASDDMKVQEKKNDKPIDKEDFFFQSGNYFQKLVSYYKAQDNSENKVIWEIYKKDGQYVSYFYHKDLVKQKVNGSAAQFFRDNLFTIPKGKSAHCDDWDCVSAHGDECHADSGYLVVRKSTGSGMDVGCI